MWQFVQMSLSTLWFVCPFVCLCMHAFVHPHVVAFLCAFLCTHVCVCVCIRVNVVLHSGREDASEETNVLTFLLALQTSSS